MTMESLLNPQGVAVIGASRSLGKVGHDILANLVRDGYQGPIVPVNPGAETLLGLPCFPSLAAAKQRVDLAVVVVPQPQVLAAVEDAVAAGVRAVVIITAGKGQ